MKGSVYKRDSVWAVSYYTGRKINNIYERKSKSGFKTKRDADIYLRKKVSEIDNGLRYKGSDVKLKIYLIDWLEQYSKIANLAQNTYRGYKNNINNHIIPIIGNIKLNDLQPFNIDDMLSRMDSSGLSVTSQRYVISTLRKALNWAIKRQYISYNVINNIDIPKPQKYIPCVLSIEQLQVLWHKCMFNFEYLPILVASALGLRRGEVLGLKWSDFDFNNNTVHIQRTATPTNGGYEFSPCKTQDSNRVLCVPDFVIISLDKWKAEQNIIKYVPDFNTDNYVFCFTNGLMSATTLNRKFKKLLRDCNLPNMRFHDLRHSWATMMLSKNIPTKITSSMLGHSNVRTTLDIYTHVLIDSQKPAIDMLNSLSPKIK